MRYDMLDMLAMLLVGIAVGVSAVASMRAQVRWRDGGARRQAKRDIASMARRGGVA